MLTKPPGIESDVFKSAKRDRLAEGRNFKVISTIARIKGYLRAGV